MDNLLAAEIVIGQGEKIVGALSTDPKGIAVSLIAKRFISQGIFDETNQLNETDTVKARRLYSAILRVIQSYPHRYDDFVEIFKGKGKLHDDLLKALRDSEDSTRKDLSRHGSDSNLSEDSGMDEISLDSVSIPFKCPCGVTDFSHCLYPSPDCLTSRHFRCEAFPELDCSGEGTHEKKAQSMLKQHLAEETESIEHEYTTLSLAVYHWAKSIQGIEGSLKQILRSRRQSVESESFDSLYNSVTTGVDFINYESLVDHVMETCREMKDDSEKAHRLQKKAEDAAKKYENAFQEFAQLRIFSHPNSVQELCCQGMNSRKELKLKIEEDFQRFPFKRIAHFKKVLRKLLNLPHNVLLRVTSVEQGCVEISFEVVGSFPEESLKLSMEQKSALLAENITLLEYAGRVHYCCCELMEEEECRMIVQGLYEKVSQADYQQDSLEDVDQELDESEHSPDCLYIQGTECRLSPCTYCGIQLRHCSLEYHTLKCAQQEKKVNGANNITSSPNISCKQKNISGWCDVCSQFHFPSRNKEMLNCPEQVVKEQCDSPLIISLPATNTVKHSHSLEDKSKALFAHCTGDTQCQQSTTSKMIGLGLLLGLLIAFFVVNMFNATRAEPLIENSISHSYTKYSTITWLQQATILSDYSANVCSAQKAPKTRHYHYNHYHFIALARVDDCQLYSFAINSSSLFLKFSSFSQNQRTQRLLIQKNILWHDIISHCRCVNKKVSAIIFPTFEDHWKCGHSVARQLFFLFECTHKQTQKFFNHNTISKNLRTLTSPLFRYDITSTVKFANSKSRSRLRATIAVFNNPISLEVYNLCEPSSPNNHFVGAVALIEKQISRGYKNISITAIVNSDANLISEANFYSFIFC